MAHKKYLSSITADGQLIAVTYWQLGHDRKSPADYLLFQPINALTGTKIVLQFGDTDGMQTIFTGDLLRKGPECTAVDSLVLFQNLEPKSYIDTTAHAVIRDICRQAGVSDPTINCPDMALQHFQAEGSAAIRLRSLVASMVRLGVAGAAGLSFYFDPAGTFYFGGFQDWKREVEVLQQRGNLVDFRSLGDGYLAEVLPGIQIYHSQQVRIIHDKSPQDFYRVESVVLGFEQGEHTKILFLKAA